MTAGIPLNGKAKQEFRRQLANELLVNPPVEQPVVSLLASPLPTQLTERPSGLLVPE